MSLPRARLSVIKSACASAACGLLLLPLNGCIMVGGYRSGSGFFIWPGSFLFLALALLYYFLRRR